MDLQSEHERYLTEEHVGRPVFVTNYPKELRHSTCVLMMMRELFPPWIFWLRALGRLLVGSQREEREDVLRAKMVENDLDPEEYWWYLDIRRYGSVPHAGFGLGLERMLMYISGMSIFEM